MSEKIDTFSSDPSGSVESRAAGIAAATSAGTSGRGKPRSSQTTSATMNSGPSTNMYRSSTRSENREANSATWSTTQTSADVVTARNARSCGLGVPRQNASTSSTRKAQAGTTPKTSGNSAKWYRAQRAPS